MTTKNRDGKALPAAGVVGLGLMGSVIAACLLAGGHTVFGVALEAGEQESARQRVRGYLEALSQAGALSQTPDELLSHLHCSQEYSSLAPCRLVVESIIEDLAIKRSVIECIEAVVDSTAIIGTNTSALPITQIQSQARHPERILGLHWVSSSPFGLVVEVMGGDATSAQVVEAAVSLVRSWGKTPTVSRRDKRGFICNRVGYALLREAFALLDEGVATPQEIDDAVRASLGTWLPFVGPFGYLDLTGLPAYANVMRELLPDLSDNDEVPHALQEKVESNARGIENGIGFYRYAGQSGQQRRQQFDDFRQELSALMARYQNPSGVTAANEASAEGEEDASAFKISALNRYV